MSSVTAQKDTNIPRFYAVRLITPEAIREAQALRYQVFSEEFKAEITCQEPELDIDSFDQFCMHLGVRERDSGQLVATTRILNSENARKMGSFYSEHEFHLHGLDQLSGDVLEVGRTCVAQKYRNGATIAVLWAELAEVMKEGRYSYLMGCASISMDDGGHQAYAITQQLKTDCFSDEHIQAVPKKLLPDLGSFDNVVSVRMPPLLKAYMRLGAKVCGEPCWDPEFNTADLFILLKHDQLAQRYVRHFNASY